MRATGEALSDDALLRLFQALADEIARLGVEVARVGEALTSEHGTGITGAGASHHLQMFDVIAQSAQAHARLLASLLTSSEMRTCATSHELKGHIETVPFHDVRQRLLTAMDGANHGENVPMLTTDIWLARDQKAADG